MLVVEFLAEWIHDNDLRCRVLKDKRTALKKLGLSPGAIDALVDLNTTDILAVLREELEQHYEIYPGKTKKVIDKTPNRKPSRSAGLDFFWDEGRAHVRRVEPTRIEKGRKRTLTVSGQGWDRGLQMWFEPVNGGRRVKGQVSQIDCDRDIWQRAKVKVTLPTPGKWNVIAVVPSYGKKMQESFEDVKLTVK
jgi:hypothetical protein